MSSALSRTAFLVGLMMIVVATAMTGVVPTRIFGHDIFFLLDNGWRVFSGQRPHLDYYSPWGPITFLITAAGFELSGGSVDAIGYGNAIVAITVGLWTYAVAESRLTTWLRLLLSWMLASLVAACYPLGLSPFLSSHAMVYNRYGYALLSLVLLETILPATGNRGQAIHEAAGGVSTGVALCLLAFLKASFLLVAIGTLVVLSVGLRRFSIRRIACIFVGGCLTTFVMLWYLKFDAAAMLSDLRMAAAARSESISLSTPVIFIVAHWALLLVLLAFCKIATVALNGRTGRWNDWGLPVAGLFVFMVDIALMSSNMQVDGFPITGVFTVLVLSEIIAGQSIKPPDPITRSRRYVAMAVLLGSVIGLPLFVMDVTGIVYGLINKLQAPPQTLLRFASPVLKPLLLYDTPGTSSRSNGRDYVTYVNEGVALLQRESGPSDTVLTMDMVNPFPYALGRPPPIGGISAMAYHYTLADGHRPTDDAYFGNADIVMVPKRRASEDMYYGDFWKAYSTGLSQRYRLAADNEWWLMYRRRQPASGTAPPNASPKSAAERE